MNFKSIFYNLKYLKLSTTFLFKNRLFIERTTKNYLVYSNIGETSVSNTWSTNKLNVLSNLTFLKLRVKSTQLLLLVLSALLLNYFSNAGIGFTLWSAADTTYFYLINCVGFLCLLAKSCTVRWVKEVAIAPRSVLKPESTFTAETPSGTPEWGGTYTRLNPADLLLIKRLYRASSALTTANLAKCAAVTGDLPKRSPSTTHLALDFFLTSSKGLKSGNNLRLTSFSAYSTESKFLINKSTDQIFDKILLTKRLGLLTQKLSTSRWVFKYSNVNAQQLRLMSNIKGKLGLVNTNFIKKSDQGLVSYRPHSSVSTNEASTLDSLLWVTRRSTYLNNFKYNLLVNSKVRKVTPSRVIKAHTSVMFWNLSYFNFSQALSGSGYSLANPGKSSVRLNLVEGWSSYINQVGVFNLSNLHDSELRPVKFNWFAYTPATPTRNLPTTANALLYLKKSVALKHLRLNTDLFYLILYVNTF